MVQLALNVPLYMVVPDAVYDSTFDSVVRDALRESKIKLIIVNLETEIIKAWIE